MLIDEGQGLWVRRLTDRYEQVRPALFLDRDGVIVEEVHFLSRASDVRLVPGVAATIAKVNRAGFPVIVVTNQSGIARGLFGWPEFVAVQEEIDRQIAIEGAHLDAVLACGYHRSGKAPLDIDHPWRKPGAAMLHRARDLLNLNLSRSYIVGDRISDVMAGLNAGIAGGWLVLTGYGRDHADRMEQQRRQWAKSGFECRTAPTAVEAIEAFLAIAGRLGEVRPV